MATVFVAEQDAEPHEIALKILRPELCADKTFAKRFEREARAAARVQHPSSVTILEAGVDGDLSYIAMELLRGDDLFALLERHGALSPRAAATIVAEVCDALAVAHGLGIVHRDLKPENIMIVRGASEGPDGPESVPLPPGARVKVLDFGIAKLLDTPSAGPRPPAGRLESPTGMTAMTRVGTLIGTPAYMSPEQCALQPVDTRSDIYTCGLLLFQMVSGRLPFDGPTPLHIATKHIHEEPPPLRSFVPDADAALDALILKALAKRPADRWLTARALGGALRKLLPSLPDRPYSTNAPAPESAATPVLLDDSVTSLRDAGLPASIGEPASERMFSAKTMVADGLVAPPPSVVVREPELPRRPLAILARHRPERLDSEVTEPAPGTPTTVHLAPEDAESVHETPEEMQTADFEAEPEDLASTLIRATPGEGAPDGGAPAAGRQLTMQSAAPLPAANRQTPLPAANRQARVGAIDAPPAPPAAAMSSQAPRGPAAVQTLVTGQPAGAPMIGRGSSPDLSPSLSAPQAQAPVAAAPYAGPPALVSVPAKMPIPAMPAASVILSPSVASPSGPIPPPPPAARAPMPSAPILAENPQAMAPTFGIPGPMAPPGIVDSGTHPVAGGASTVGRALWLGVLIGVVGSALLFALAYAIFLAK